MTRPSKRGGADADIIEALADLSRDQLVERWTKTFKRRPPKSISRTLLERSAAYQAQVKAYGDKSVATRRALRSMLTEGNNTQAAKPASHQSPRLEPGVRLVRDWNGRTYSVDVIDDGFVWDGKVHKSLSAIARKITGARWSGPRFFGL